jgi:hypothetical protein
MKGKVFLDRDVALCSLKVTEGDKMYAYPSLGCLDWGNKKRSESG